MNKAQLRQRAKENRSLINKKFRSRDIAIDLTPFFPLDLLPKIIAGFAPIQDEIDVWPLLCHLHASAYKICLPLTPIRPAPLSFRQWEPGSRLAKDRYGISYPATGEELCPDFILLPLLAFTSRGARLGYGGGYYDRTLQLLRSRGEIFACGVAYAGQEMDALPVGDHDQHLDGVLTETGFRKF